MKGQRHELADVPGFVDAVLAVDAQWPDIATACWPHDATDVVALVMGVTRGHVQAEVLADLSDDLLEAGAAELAELAELMDLISYDMRGRLSGSR